MIKFLFNGREYHMTYEELKAEAERQGYTLIKKKPYIPHAKCSCGKRGHIQHKYDVNEGKGYYRVCCDKCDNKTDWNLTIYDSWKEWYLRSTQ